MHLSSLNLNTSKSCIVSLDLSHDVIIGRDAGAFPGGDWDDRFLSRRHAVIQHQSGKWQLTRIPGEDGQLKSPIFRDPARTLPIAEHWEMIPGEWLYISGKGSTAITLVQDPEHLPPLPAEALHDISPASSGSFPPWQKSAPVAGYETVAALPYAVKLRLQVLERDLPAAIESWMETGKRGAGQEPGSPGSEEFLFDAVGGVLRQAIVNDSGGGGISVAFLSLDPEALEASLAGSSEGAPSPWSLLHEDPPVLPDFRPSRHQLAQTLAGQPGEIRVWQRQQAPTDLTNSLATHVDWVMTVCLKGARSEGRGAPPPLRLRRRPVVLYIACQGGQDSPPPDIEPFIRTLSLQVSGLLEAREQQRLQTQLARYFSPRLRRLVREEPESLEPVVFNCTVLFCDRRGSSLAAESADSRTALLSQLSENTSILGLVADEIFRGEGAIADFAGDGVLGFWGWPADDRATEHALQAIEAAGRIAASLIDRQVPNPALLDEMRVIVHENTETSIPADLQLFTPAFRIGISTGDMAVGNVGLREQMKIGVFGGPVNFGARLEGLGKTFQLPVILSEETYRAVGDRALMRKLCYIRPAGFGNVYPIYELVLPKEWGGSGATPDQIHRYEGALEHFTQRKFGVCIQILARLVAEGDTGAVWLLKMCQILQREKPADDWQGEITASSK